MRVVKIERSWKIVLEDQFASVNMSNLSKFLRSEKATGKIIYPPGKDIFNAFELTPFERVKVVLLGQDPYHGPGQAHGLSFSVRKGLRPPPSLQNIYKELSDDIGIPIPKHGNLEPWARQGVLLLNTNLTVEDGKAGSHSVRGWESFTDAVIKQLSQKRCNLVFMLWGKKAQQKGSLINQKRHLILEAAHPSPFSANNGFFGSAPFSRANRYLLEHDIEPIDWAIN